MKPLKALSIVIPAHNEEVVIEGCLQTLLGAECYVPLEIIVVCNACTDRTAEIARQFNVKVIEKAERSKVAALNAGDRAARYFPRVYLDADIQVTIGDLLSAAAMLDGNTQASAPQPKLDLSGSSWAVRSFYRVWQRLPYYSSGHMVGSGVFILSEEGRGRFRRFPSLIADDAWVRGLFNFREIANDSRSSFTISAPTRVRDLIAIRTRARFGNIELAKKYPEVPVAGEHSGSTFLSVVLRRPNLLIPTLIYVCVQLAAVFKCWGKLRKSDYGTWERDDSSRQHLAENIRPAILEAEAVSDHLVHQQSTSS